MLKLGKHYKVDSYFLVILLTPLFIDCPKFTESNHAEILFRIFTTIGVSRTERSSRSNG